MKFISTHVAQILYESYHKLNLTSSISEFCKLVSEGFL